MPMRQHSPIPRSDSIRLAAQGCVVAIMAILGSVTHALPSDGVVTNGNAAISGQGTGNLTITQTSNSATIHWQSFNVGASESVRFVQPSSSAVTLNRVLGSDPSQILGRLSANGQVFLINPNGILFGRGASVNVGGLVASTLNLADTDFLAGRYQFQSSSGSTVRNQGTIQTPEGGYVALLGNQVFNDGAINSPQGSVALAAGNAVTLDFAGDGLLKVAVSRGALDAMIQNGGMIQADGGNVWMSASARDALLSTVIANTGIVQANSVGVRNGRIYLDGGDSGVVSVDGTLQAAGTTTGSTGGSIVVSGDKIAVNADALLNASGDAGGGTIAVGGGWQGADPSIRAATGVYVAPGATLDASALVTGDGGTIVTWSDIHKPGASTRVYGTLRATGGSQSGNGGRIETSGHWLDVRGIRLDASAPHGQGGQWLLDPEDLTVGGVATDAVFTPPGPFALFTSGAGTPNVLNTDIEAQLNAGVDVILQTAPTGAGAGNIAINANISKTGGIFAALTLQAHGGIALGNGISISASVGSLDVNLLAGGTISLGSGSSIATNGGDIVLSGNRLNNNAGAGVFNTAGGRWLVYTNSPLTDNIGGLNSGNPAIWGQDPGSLPPPSVAPGNWFVYAAANPTTAVTQTVGALSSTQSFSNLPPVTTSAALLLLELDPPDWLTQTLEQGAPPLVPMSAPGQGSSGSTPTFPAGAMAGLAGTAPPPSASPTPTTSRLQSSGLSGTPKPSPSAAPTSNSRPPLEAFLKGALRAEQVGTSSSGAVLLATVTPRGQPPRMVVTVAPGEGFRIALPPQLLQTLKTDGRTPALQAQVSGGSLPAWLRFDRSGLGLNATAVPTNALPLTVRLTGSNGKFVDITVQ